MRKTFHLFFTSLGFLTILPTPQSGTFEEEDFGKAGVFYPLVGLILGAIWLPVGLLLQKVLPAEMAALLTLLVWEGLSGFLHLDGLGDCGDALLAPAKPEKRWEILHDSRLGTFGLVTLFFHLTAKFLALNILLGSTAPILLLCVPVFARLSILPVVRQPLIASSKIAALFQKGFGTRQLILALLLPLFLAAFSPLQGFPMLGLALLLAFLLSRFAYKKLQGINGDVLGMLIELNEVFMLILLSVLQGIL